MSVPFLPYSYTIQSIGVRGSRPGGENNGVRARRRRIRSVDRQGVEVSPEPGDPSARRDPEPDGDGPVGEHDEDPGGGQGPGGQGRADVADDDGSALRFGARGPFRLPEGVDE